MAGQMGVAGGGENAVVAQNLLHFQQIDPGFDQMCGIAVAQAVRAYFSPSWTAFQADRGRDFSVIVDGISN